MPSPHCPRPSLRLRPPLAPETRPHRTGALLAALALAVSACAAPAEEVAPVEAAEVIDEERCAANRAAGPITYVTGYEYQASVSILEAVAAEALGLFEEVCLDVEIEPGTGDTMANVARISAGDAQFTSLGNEAEVLQAGVRGHDILGLATYGHVPIATLLTSPDVEDLTQLEGTALGHKGMLPAPLEAMLVAEGVDVTALHLVEVGYDPSVLPEGQVRALTGFRSNEPLQLVGMGAEFNEWLPEDSGVTGSFGVMATSPAFAAQHPTAVEDYLRALAHAFDHCQENGAECVGYAADLAGEGYDAEHNLNVWNTERDLVTSFTPEGSPPGYIDLVMTEQEAMTLVENGELDSLPELEGYFDPTYLEAVHLAGEVSWGTAQE